MEHQHELDISRPLDIVWPALTDLQRVADALPGAHIEDQGADGSSSGVFKVKLGAFTAAFRGTASYTEIDQQAHCFVLEGSGGSAHGNAVLTVRGQAVDLDGTHTRVLLHSSINLTGRLAQFGSSMADDVVQQLMDHFTTNLVASFTGQGETPGSAGASTRAPGGVPEAHPKPTNTFDVGGVVPEGVRRYGALAIVGTLGLGLGLLFGRWSHTRETPFVIHLVGPEVSS